MAKQVEYPADTVDSDGKAWETVGENIRKGKKELDIEYDNNFENLMKVFYDKMYPVGSQFLGQLPEILFNWFTWEKGVNGQSKSNPCYITLYGNENNPISYSDEWTIPMLRDSDVQKFTNALDITPDSGVYSIPIWTRKA